MALASPQLDDRTFAQLLQAAREHIAARCPDWTLGAHDPGVVLLEAFAFLTETLLYRINQLPEKVYVELLRLINVRQQPPAAARVSLRFELPKARAAPLVVPRGTPILARGAGGAGNRVVFATVEEAQIPAGQTAVTTLALHCEPVDAEPLGVGTGRGGQALRVKSPPIIAPTGDLDDMVVGVEAASEQEALGLESRRVGDTVYIVWREVDGFGPLHAGRRVFVADRLQGTISFAPAARQLDATGLIEDVARPLAEVPGQGRRILAWYRRGGGAEGNLPPGSLAEASGLAGVAVAQDEPATGGADAESLANALVRGPEELHSLRRAVTARDFETLARRNVAGVDRARAVTAAEIWRHARPGTIEVLLVPSLPPEVRGPGDSSVTAAVLRRYEKDEIRARIQADLDTRRPMGTTCQVSWAKYKTVKVKATLRARRTADFAGMRAQATASLLRYLTPLTRDDGSAWEFGDPVPVSYVSYLLQRVPGVLAAEKVRVIVDQAPSGATTVAADCSQPGTFYAGDGASLYRSLDGGNAWELLAELPGERIDRIESHPQVPGLLAVAARVLSAAGGDPKSRLHLSWDCGETWRITKELPLVEDLSWTTREGRPIALLATGAALFDLEMRDEASPRLVTVKDRANLPLWAVASTVNGRGNWAVAVAPQDQSGVYVSRAGGADGSFTLYGLPGKDLRALGFQQDGGRTFLWAGLTMPGAVPGGGGCYVRELDSAADWAPRNTGWNGGTCFAFTFDGSKVYAGSHSQGVAWLDSSKAGAGWTPALPQCGLPERSEARLFHPVRSVTARVLADDPPQVLAAVVPPADAGPRRDAGGVFRSVDDLHWVDVSRRELDVDSLSLPSTWLFASGEHEIEVKPL